MIHDIPTDEPAPLLVYPPPTSDERMAALWCHLGGFFTWIIIPLVLWLTKPESRFIAHHAKQALNFQITILIPYFLCFFVMAGAFFHLALLLVGLGLLLLMGLLETLVVILAAVAATRGELYRYPLNIRFVK